MNKDRENGTWCEDVQCIKTFIAKNMREPNPHTKRESFFASWLRRQRAAREENALEPWQEELMDEIETLLMELRISAEQRKKLLELRAYIEENGKLPTPVGSGAGLYSWICKMVYRSYDGKLDAVLQEELEKVGVCFDPATPPITKKQYFWNQAFFEFDSFYRIHGRAPSSKESPRLYQWGHHYKDKLSELGYIMSLPRQKKEKQSIDEKVNVKKWEDNLSILCEYVRTHGQMPRCADASLYRWVCRQERLLSDGQLPDWKRRRLEEAGFTFAVSSVEFSFDGKREGEKVGKCE